MHNHPGNSKQVPSAARVESNFPEHLFPVPARRSFSFQRLVEQGSRKMAQTRMVICGLARDVAEILPSNMARFERLGAMFLDYRIVVVENDSSDATEEILADWAVINPRVVVLSEHRGDPINPGIRCPQRGSRMAKYRNRYREYVAKHMSHFDVVIAADMDILAGFSYAGICHTFGHANWDFVGSYGIVFRRTKILGLRCGPVRPVHYDAWAYRSLNDDTELSTAAVNALRWERGDELVSVNSCFGGLGVYRMEAILRSHYEGGDCEHVSFHREMRQQGLTRLYLNPAQIVNYGYRGSTGFGSRQASIVAAPPESWLMPFFSRGGKTSAPDREGALQRRVA
jgi:hypothetical protein